MPIAPELAAPLMEPSPVPPVAASPAPAADPSTARERRGLRGAVRQIVRWLRRLVRWRTPPDQP
ncbi:MAG: hypothetical protein HC911_18255 [Chloroflexaceae bacterium]|nr:hypothetical protein [Chloroflexaceae bacterium]